MSSQADFVTYPNQSARSVAGRLLDFATSIWTGIVLLILLFIYCSIGSALPQVRQLRMLEMTEFEWFNWWPFNLLVIVMCLNIIASLIRRTPRSWVTLGSWLAHGGVLVLVVGSWVYFGSKLEGDARVIRRSVQISGHGITKANLIGLPGAQLTLRGDDGEYAFEVAETDPNYQGKKTYAVSVNVKTPRGEFSRPLLEGTSQTTDGLNLSLTYALQPYFELSDTAALYVRPVGAKHWHQRPLKKLPRYNTYIGPEEEIWSNEAVPAIRQKLDLLAPASEQGDAYPQMRITAFLPYAMLREQRVPGGTEFYPMAALSLNDTQGHHSSALLAAFDPEQAVSSDGMLGFHWVKNTSEMQTLLNGAQRKLTIHVAGSPVYIDDPLTKTAVVDPKIFFTSIPGTDYSYRVKFVYDGLRISEDRVISVAGVEVKNAERSYVRWVANDPNATRDLPAGDMDSHDAMAMDELIDMQYVPGALKAPFTVVAGLKDVGVHLLSQDAATGAMQDRALQKGKPLPLNETVSLTLEELTETSHVQNMPMIVPPAQRSRDAGAFYSLIKAEITQNGKTQSQWLKYHDEALPDESFASGGRFRYAPAQFDLPDGRKMEVLFSRERRALPAPVVLKDFTMSTNEGGYTGDMTSIRNWTSSIAFLEKNALSQVLNVSVNHPQEYKGLWFYQATWDMPDERSGSSGMNYTGLGVGNRRGVWIQLLGCMLIVLGMGWAYYAKPLFLRGDVLPLGQNEEPLPEPAKAYPRTALIILMALVAAAGVAISRGMSHSETAKVNAFASQVDLSPLAKVAVYFNGRLRSFDSFTQSMMRSISGSRKVDGQSPTFTYFDLAFRPDTYADRDYIYVKNRLMRQQMVEALKAQPVDSARLERIGKSGLIAPALLQTPGVQAVLSHQGEDLMRTAKYVNQIETAMALSDPQELLGRLQMIPPQGNDKNATWLNISHAEGGTQAIAAVQQEWQALSQAWRAENAGAVNESVRKLERLLPNVNPSIYPNQSRLGWESWYFNHRNLSWGWMLYMLALVPLLMATAYRWRAARRIGLAIFTIAFLVQTAALLVRWYVAGRFPNANMYEAVTTAAWFGGIGALILEWIVRQRAMRNWFAIGSACASMVALMAVNFLPVQLNAEITNMMPVLNDVWLYIHTNVIIFSYCLIFMSAVTASGYLLWRLAGGGADYAALGGAASLMVGGRSAKTSAGQILDGATMILLEVAIILLWLGIVMGAIWADHSWGRPWGWDPKEVFALNTLFIFIILMHVRLKANDKGLWTAVLALAGCLVMLFNWIVINYVISGLHSYA